MTKTSLEPVAPATSPRPRGRRKRRRFLIGVLLLLVLGLVVCVAVVMTRPVREELRATATDGGVTYLVIGNDSREHTPQGVKSFGDKTKFAGSRADVVLLVHRASDGSTHTVSVPRDIVVERADGAPTRLALTLLDGVQQTVDALCRTLKVGVNHVVMIDGAGVTDTVNARGGVTVTLDHPVRDAQAALALPAGTQRLDGTQALALVRSRHPEQNVGGTWRTADEATGAAWRASWSATVFTNLQNQLASAGPSTLAKVAWTVSGDLTVDSGMGPPQFIELARAASSPKTLPIRTMGGLAVAANDATRSALAAANLGEGCSTGA